MTLEFSTNPALSMSDRHCPETTLPVVPGSPTSSERLTVSAEADRARRGTRGSGRRARTFGSAARSDRPSGGQSPGRNSIGPGGPVGVLEHFRAPLLDQSAESYPATQISGSVDYCFALPLRAARLPLRILVVDRFADARTPWPNFGISMCKAAKV
jgi:hypothetical protein